jgi:general secretion pathway protein G
MKNERGFTLIELLITLAIMAILAMLVTPVAQTAIQRAHEAELRRALREIRDAIDAYKKANDGGHINRAAQGSGYPKTLSVLVEGVEDIRSPQKAKIYFLRRLPRDPMESDEQMDAEATWGKRSYASSPDEPSEGEDVYDVYSKSTDTGLNGLPYAKW